jgi:hypothetical protein
MSNRCAICSKGHATRAEVDRLLGEGVALRAIEKRVGVSDTAIRRHRDRCPPPPGAVAPAPMPPPETLDLGRLTLIAVRGVELAYAIALKQRDSNPAVAARAASAASNGARRLIEAAADQHFRQRLLDRLGAIERTISAEAQLSEAAAAAEAARAPSDPGGVVARLRASLDEVPGCPQVVQIENHHDLPETSVE